MLGARMPVIPSRVYLDVTNACQLRCRHCCTSSGAPRADELELDEILSVVDQVRAMGVERLVISGGEPLRRPGLATILEHARSLGLQVTLLTNGLLIDEDWTQRLVALQVRVKISLDGATAATHDFLRGKGAFERTCAVLRGLSAAGAPDLTVHYTVHRKNLAELSSLPDLLSRLGVKNVVIGTIKPSGRARSNHQLLIPPHMIPYVQQRVRAIQRHAGITLCQLQDRGWEGFGCPATCNKLGLTASGRLTTCAFFGQEYLGGSIRQHSLETLWRDHLTRGDMFVANASCASCPSLARCGGGCRARALYYQGDINATDPHCCAFSNKQAFLDSHSPQLEAARQGDLGAFL